MIVSWMDHRAVGFPLRYRKRDNLQLKFEVVWHAMSVYFTCFIFGGFIQQLKGNKRGALLYVSAKVINCSITVFKRSLFLLLVNLSLFNTSQTSCSLSRMRVGIAGNRTCSKRTRISWSRICWEHSSKTESKCAMPQPRKQASK